MKILEIKSTNRIKQVLINLKVPFTSQSFRTVFQLYKNENVWVDGIPSRCQDHLQVIFMDYDHTKLENLENEVKGLQNYFKLSHAYVFKNDKENSYHVVILDKLPMLEVFNILKNSSIDFAFLNAPKYSFYREWALRISKKGENRQEPVFLKVIKSIFDEREISTAHKLFLMKYYEVPVLKYKKEDGNTVLEFVKYQTGAGLNVE